MNIPADLQVADLLLYSTPELVDDIIEWKTGDNVAHIEVYVGNGLAWASRNGVGVNEYPFRDTGLVYVRRPKLLPDMIEARKWFEDGVRHLPYGFCDILATMNIKSSGRGVDCSHFVAAFCEIAGCSQFDASYPKNKITPRDFKTSFESLQVWSAV
jgi:hypothetical protein